MSTLKLGIEPIPGASWGISLSQRLPAKEWAEIRTEVYRLAGYKCQICGSFNTELHAHEVWGYREKERVQYLIKIQCLCKTCHDVKHLGRSRLVYEAIYVRKLEEHWCKVNKLTLEDLKIYESRIHKISSKRADRIYLIKVGRRILY